MTALPGTTGRRRIYLMRHGHVDYFTKEVREAVARATVRMSPRTLRIVRRGDAPKGA